MSEELNEKLENTHIFLEMVIRELDEILVDCPNTDLYKFNQEAYSIYSAVFLAIKTRIAQESIMRDFIINHTNPWTQIEH